MTYLIARGGQTFGPYTEPEVRQYIASGNIGLSDLVQAGNTGDWVPVATLFPSEEGFNAAPTAESFGSPLGYSAPPDFPWWAALLLGLVTGGLFFVFWDIVQASWMKRVEKNSAALLLYIGIAILYLFKLPSMWNTVSYNMFGGPEIHTHGSTFGSIGLILAVVARFVFRRELLDHFNIRERFPLRLNAFWTLCFGGLYFQYHFNRINQARRLGMAGAPAI